MALNRQTEMVFGNESPRVDPVSGNEVPPGAMPEEVRDDIPALLSEGEYVVPADVLQYYGIKFFEDLRGKAKTDLANLESNGRTGGEPIDDGEDFPFSVEDLNTYEDSEPVAANMGGVIRGYEEGGVTEMSPIGPSSALKTYINDEGSRLFIRFLNGVAVPPVPPGYREEGTASAASAASTDTTSSNPCPAGYVLDPVKGICVPITSEQDDESNKPALYLRDLDKMNAAQLAQYAAEISKTGIYKTISKSGIAQLLGIGRQEKKVIGYLEEKLKVVPEGSLMANFYQDLLDGIESGDRKGLEALVEEIKTNNPGMVTSVLVELGIKTGDKTSTYFDTVTSSNNTLGLEGTKYGVALGAGQLDTATAGGTYTPGKTDPYGIGTTGEYGGLGTAPVVDTSVYFDEELDPGKDAGVDYVVGEEGGLGSAPTAPYVTRDVFNIGKTGEYGGLGIEAKNIELLTNLNKNPENAKVILSRSIPSTVSAQDSAVLTSNLMSPRLGYESGRDALQERLVKGLYGETLPLTDSQTLAKADTAKTKELEAAVEESRKRVVENDKYIASLVADIEKTRREDREEEEAAVAGGYRTGDTSKNTSGGRFMNKGGLASKRKTKKKK
jgi:hypothetical protein